MAHDLAYRPAHCLLPRPRPLPRLGEAEHGPARPFTTLGWMPRTSSGQCLSIPSHVSPAFPLLIQACCPLRCPCIVIHSLHCSWRCIFTLSVLVRCVRMLGGEVAGREGVRYVPQGHPTDHGGDEVRETWLQPLRPAIYWVRNADALGDGTVK